MIVSDSEPKRLLILPVEIKAREFRSRLLIALYAVSLGCRVVFGHQKTLFKVMPQFAGSLYFDKSMAVKNLGDLDFDSIEYVAADEEGIGAQALSYIYLKIRHSGERFKNARYFFCWGEYERNLVKEAFPEAEDKLVVSGNPRVDFWASDAKKVFEDKGNEYRHRFGKFILISSNFVGVRTKDDTRLGKKGLRTMGLLDDEKAKNIFGDCDRYFRQSLVKMDQLIFRLAEEFPDMTIVIRPHPGEWLEGWQEIFRDVKNVEIVYEGELGPWIIASEVLVHSACTAGIEAVLMGQKVVAYKSVEGFEYSEYVANQVGYVATDEDAVVRYITSIVGGSDDEDLYKQQSLTALSSYISNIGEKSYERMVDQLMELANWKPQSFLYTPIAESFKKLEGYKAWPAYQKLKYAGYWLKWKGKPPTGSNLKFDEIGETELKEAIDAIFLSTGLSRPCSIRKLEDSLFLLS